MYWGPSLKGFLVLILFSLDFAVHIVMNTIHVEYADGGMFFAEVFVWPDQVIFIVWVWLFIVGLS